MTTEERRPLFRPEAVAHHARGATERRVLDLGERRTSWAFRFLLLLVVAALVAVFTVRADESAKGTAIVNGDGRHATLTLPVGALGRLAVGQVVHVHAGGHDVSGQLNAAGVPANDGTATTTAVLDASLPPGVQGGAEVRIARSPLWRLLTGRHGG